MSSDLFSVENKVVIVTGASRGIGQALADGFLEKGSRVVFVARSAEMVERVQRLPSDRTLAIQCDVGQPESVARICAKTEQKFGRVDVLVNNAAITLPGAEPYADETWDQTMAVNLRAVFRLSRDVAEIMKRHGGGSIINIASINAGLAFPGNPSYQVAKAGVSQLSKAMALDLTQHNIRCNSILPGYIRTSMTAGSWEDPEKRAIRTNRTIMGRWGTPADLVGPCLFLASNASAYLTGCDLPVDGGWMVKGM